MGSSTGPSHSRASLELSNPRETGGRSDFDSATAFTEKTMAHVPDSTFDSRQRLLSGGNL